LSPCPLAGNAPLFKQSHIHDSQSSWEGNPERQHPGNRVLWNPAAFYLLLGLQEMEGRPELAPTRCVHESRARSLADAQVLDLLPSRTVVQEVLDTLYTLQSVLMPAAHVVVDVNLRVWFRLPRLAHVYQHTCWIYRCKRASTSSPIPPNTASLPPRHREYPLYP
jgi:hypothetical protein